MVYVAIFWIVHAATFWTVYAALRKLWRGRRSFREMGRILQNMGRYRDYLASSRFICLLMYDDAGCNVYGTFGSLTLARILNCVCSKVKLQFVVRNYFWFIFDQSGLHISSRQIVSFKNLLQFSLFVKCVFSNFYFSRSTDCWRVMHFSVPLELRSKIKTKKILILCPSFY